MRIGLVYDICAFALFNLFRINGIKTKAGLIGFSWLLVP